VHRGCDPLTRHGGDEFVIVLEELTDLEQATSIGQRVLSAFNEPLRTVVGSIPMSASIGIHVATDNDDYESLLPAAGSAMYDVKRNGRGGIRFSPPGKQ